jgi:Fic family protein
VPGGWGSFDDDEPSERELLEGANGRTQARFVRTLIRESVRLSSSARSVRTIDPALVCELNRLAMAGLIPTAGQLRPRSDIKIAGSRHAPPGHEQVPDLLKAACDEINAQPNGDALSLAACILWRICWIHPFEDGNGRTARAVSYLVLSERLGLELPGALPIPARIKFAPIAYTRALEAADLAYAQGRLDVTQLEKLLAFYLEAQINEDPPGLPPSA